MRNNKININSLRALRKASHLTNKAVKKGSHLMDGVERRTTRLIIEASGSTNGSESVDIDRLIYDSFPQTFPVHPALPVVGQKPSVTVFAFLDPRGFYGGIATLLCVGATLANKLGYDFRVAQTTGFSKDNTVLRFLKSNGITISEDRFSTIDLSRRNVENFAYLPLHPDDVVVVSAWWDAHIAAQLPLRRKFLYLIQDFEPIFYNNSDSYVLADQTYLTEKFIPIFNTEILYKFFVREKYSYIAETAVWFEPAPAPKTIKKSSSNKTPKTKKIFLYGRPSVHRNLFFSALQALDIALQNKDMRKYDWEIYCAGSSGVPSIKLHSGNTIKSLGKMELADYYAWAQTVDIALSPMLAPHPNYPTLELAALGSMVVTTKWKTKQDLSQYSSNILMAEPTATSMAEKLVLAANTPIAQREINKSANNIESSWPDALNHPIAKISAIYNSQR